MAKTKLAVVADTTEAPAQAEAKFVTDSGTSIKKMIASIHMRANKLAPDIAVAAASCVMHAIKYGDVTLADTLCEALSNGSTEDGKTPWRVNALRQWFITMGPFAWNNEAKKFALDGQKQRALRKEIGKNKNKFASALVREPYWVFKPEPEFKGFDFKDALTKLVKRAHKVQEDKDKSKHKDNDFSGLDKAEHLLTSI